MSLLSGPGATFGEVALLKEDDCLRTASILASDSTVDLIEIDRNLYNRCVYYHVCSTVTLVAYVGLVQYVRLSP